MRKLIIIFLSMTFAFMGNAHIEAKKINPFKIGVLYWSMNIEGQVAMRSGLEEWARYINSETKNNKKRPVELISLVAGDGSKGIKNQVVQMKEMIKKNPDAIILQPTDSKALSEPLKMANAKNIPVIVYDQHIEQGKMTSYITSNNYQAGQLGAEFIDSQYKNKEEIKIVIAEYPKVSSTTERVNGFIDELNKSGQNYKVLKRYRAVDPDSGKLAAQKFLKDFPQKNSVDVFFTVNDGGGLPIVDALAKAGRTEVKVATVDGDPKSVTNISQGRITVINSAQFCAELGRLSLKVAYNFLNGKKVPEKILVPTFPVTKETLSNYKGWLSRLPNKFKKEWNNELWDNSLIIQ